MGAPSNSRLSGVVAGIGSNLAAEFARAAMAPIIAIVAARYLGIDGYGLFATGQVLVAFAATLTGFGLLYAILQLAARRQETLSSLLGSSIFAALLTAVVTYGGLAAWVNLFSYDMETQKVTFVMGASLFPIAVSMQLMAALQVQGRYARIAAAGGLGTVLNVAYALAVVATDRGLMALAAAPIVYAVTQAAVMAWSLRGELSLDLRLARVGTLFRTGFLFGLGDFLYFIYFSIDLVILSLMVGERSVGFYNVPVRVLVVAYLVPMVIFNRVLYPRYFDWSMKDRERLRRTYVLASKGMLVAGLLVASLLVVFAGPVVPAVFGGSFSESADLLRILALAVPLRYVAASAAAVLVTTDLIHQKVRVQAATAALNVVLCLALIRPLEATGAAIATVITEGFLVTSYVIAVRRWALDVDLVREVRPWLFVVPAVAILAAAILAACYQPQWAITISGLVAIGALVVAVWPMRYFGKTALQVRSRALEDSEQADLT